MIRVLTLVIRDMQICNVIEKAMEMKKKKKNEILDLAVSLVIFEENSKLSNGERVNILHT